MGPQNWFSSAPGAKSKMTFWKNFIKYPKMKRCCFGRFMFVFSNADEKPLSFGFLNERAVSFTCSRENWNHKQSASFSEILWDLWKCHFKLIHEEQNKIKILGPWGSCKLSYYYTAHVCCSVLQCVAVCCSVCMHESCHTPSRISYTTTVVLILQNSARHCRRSFC